MTFELKDIIVIGGALVAAATSFGVSQYRIDQLEETMRETRGEPLKLQRLEWRFGQLQCDVRNVKRLIKQQPEQDCP